MLRNLVVLIAGLGGVTLLFMGYRAMTHLPPDLATEHDVALPSLPPPTSGPADSAILIHTSEVAAAVPPGQSTVFTVFDPRSGDATEQYDLGSWRKAPGAEGEFLVERPKITRRLPSGMTATITADEGRIVVEGVDPRTARPESGRMQGNVSIVIDRNTERERSPTSERPDDLITILLEDLEFNRELGLLRSSGAVRLSAIEATIEGAGLELNWNQYENRVERLALARDGRLVLRGGALPGAAPRANEKSPSASAPAAQSRRAEYGYRVTLVDEVVIDQVRGDQRLGGLTADRVVLTYDLGRAGQTDPAAEPQSAPTSEPADVAGPTTQSAPAPQQLVARWRGRMTLDPIPVAGATPRKRIDAEGAPLTLDLGERSVRAGRLAYHEDTKRVWLSPPTDEMIELRVGSRMTVRAASVYFEQAARLIKLIGPVELAALRGGPGRESLRASAMGWLELQLRPESATASRAAAPVADGAILLEDGEIESARLVGDAVVRVGAQSLAAHELRVSFGGIGPSGDPALESVTAQGDVLLVSGPSAADLSGAILAQAATLPQAALGAAWATLSRRQTLACTWMKIRFERYDGGESSARMVEALGAIELIDWERNIRARGQRLDAELEPGGALQQATIRGGQSPASAFARGYLIRGAEIIVNESSQTLRAPGAAEITFRATRSFQGRDRGSAAPARVRCSQGIEIDWDGPAGGDAHGIAQFSGNVHGEAGDETIDASLLTLTLAPTESAAAPPSLPWKTYLRMLRPAVASRPGPAAERALTRRATRREPEKLSARDARVGSATRLPDDARPVVQQWIAAPELQVEIPLRRIQTVGTTSLYMEDRRFNSGQAAGPTLGLPSAFLSSGPSQTAMQCSRAMTYVIGADGPQRRDSVFFDGGVIFRHVTGRDMVNPEQMLPHARDQADLLAQLKNRNAYLMCDKLEGEFAVGPSSEREAGLPARMSLSSLNALGQVYLRDQRDNWAVTVDAARVELDRAGGIVRVLGDPTTGTDARVTEERPGAEIFNVPAIGREVIIDLNSNTIRTQDRVKGRTSG